MNLQKGPGASRGLSTETDNVGVAAIDSLVSRVESVQSMLAELFAERFPSLEAKVEALREILTSRRKDHFVVEEIAQLTGRSAYTIRRWIGEGKLKAIRLRDGGPRGRLLVSRSELEKLVATGRGADVPDAAVGTPDLR